ncbi:MAG TPA: MFS transporter [Pseudonocardiaceae bacterium]|jgi:MFS family permease
MNVRWVGLAASGNLAQLPIAMRPLLITLLGAQQTGAFAVAGLAGGAAAVGMAVTSPGWSRALFRFGEGRVLAVSGLLFAGAQVALVTCHGPPAFVSVAAVSGLCTPPVAGCVRGALPQLTSEEGLTRAYAVNSVLLEIIYVVGPLWVAGWMALAGAAVALFASTLAGVVGLVVTVALVPAGREPAARVRGGSWSVAAVCTLGGTYLAYWICMGAMWVLVPAFAAHAGRPGQSGLLVAVWSAGSLIGGLALARRPPRRSHRDSYLALLAVLAVTSLALVLPRTVALMAPALVLFGLALAPWLAVGDRLTSMVGRHRSAELYGWLTTVGQIGNAIGSVLAGPVADRDGGGPAFLLVSAALGLGLAAALSRRHTLPDNG